MALPFGWKRCGVGRTSAKPESTPMNSVPFSVDGVMTDFADLEGMMRLEGAGLVLEFRIKDSVFGVLKSQLQEIQLPFGELAEVTFKRGWFWGTVILRGRRMDTLASVPGTKDGELRLRCRLKHCAAARELASNAGMRMVALDLSRMVEETNRANVVTRPALEAGSTGQQPQGVNPQTARESQGNR
jgi:hypothetical protein